jgi:hypothetical protein
MHPPTQHDGGFLLFSILDQALRSLRWGYGVSVSVCFRKAHQASQLSWCWGNRRSSYQEGLHMLLFKKIIVHFQNGVGSPAIAWSFVELI